LRVILRYGEISRGQFEKTCSDLKIKLELLEAKHDQEIVRYVRRIMNEWMSFNRSMTTAQFTKKVFPFELDLMKAAACLEKEAPKSLDPLLIYRDEADESENCQQTSLDSKTKVTKHYSDELSETGTSNLVLVNDDAKKERNLSSINSDQLDFFDVRLENNEQNSEAEKDLWSFE
jgi:hypothetical protein